MTDVTDFSPQAIAVDVRIGRLSPGDHPLFEDFAITLPAGRWTCLLGASGVGKTQLLRQILGLDDTAQQRSVTCDDGLPLAGRVAYMAQTDLLLPWLSVLDNVILGSRLRRHPRNLGRARELLAAIGLEDRMTDRPAALSGGMRQRVALVRTLMEDRPVVLMDEPFSAVDAVTRIHLQDLAASLLRDRTVLLVTHDPLEALRLGHYIHVLSGRPARLQDPLIPDGIPPRNLEDPAILTLQGHLLHRLADAP